MPLSLVGNILRIEKKLQTILSFLSWSVVGSGVDMVLDTVECIVGRSK